MPTPFIMPKFDMDQETGRLVEWIKGEGDWVELDEIILVIETDKVAVDVPSPASGILARITAREGDEVPIAAEIAYILGEGENVEDLPLPVNTAAAPTTEARKQPEQKKEAGSEVSLSTPASPYEQAAIDKSVSPVAQKMIQKSGIDINQISATGRRITKKDVEGHLAKFKTAAGRVKTPATPAARRLARESELDLTAISGSGPGGRVQASDVAGALKLLETGSYSSRPAEIVSLTGIRRTMAERMQTSFKTAPHIFLSAEVDVTSLQKQRSVLNSINETINISLTSILVKLISQVLQNHPYINASLIDEEIYLWREVNVGVAAAIDEGLIVPVIHRASEKDIYEIDNLLKKLVQKARTGKLNLDDVRGGTFTISNLGMFDIDRFQAIINPPESAILAVGKVSRKPVVIDEQDTVAIRPRMNLTLSADHRVIDGLTAARFLSDLVQAIESPE